MRHVRSVFMLGLVVAAGVAIRWLPTSGHWAGAFHPTPSLAMLSFAVAAFVRSDA